MLNESLKTALAASAHHKELFDVMEYAVFPAGKLFRPKLVEALALDLTKSMSKNHGHLASALEIHHAYTLVHDDLPAMDNDLIRRGKPSTHAAFGEWKAILAGDALLIYSFEELMKIDHPELKNIHRLFSWATGAKGLISGQFRDLAAQGKASFEETVRIHELKTARLIQIAMVGTYYLSTPKKNLKSTIEFLRLGREIGVSFQLLDDLNELTDETISAHEKEINPFLISPEAGQKELFLSIERLQKIILKNRLTNLDSMLKDYFKKNQENLISKGEILQKNLQNGLNLGKFNSWLKTLA